MCCGCLHDFCCGCNCCIFPAPYSNYLIDQKLTINSRVLSFTNSKHKIVPYLKVTDQARENSKTCVIYFHGNAEDIDIVAQFLQAIFDVIKIPIYAMEYPSYGIYESFSWLISDGIKRDSLQFYQHLRGLYQPQNIIILGRSIGTGPACYLASERSTPYLMLISPFDTIRDVARTHVGCISCILKNHFNNIACIRRYKGKLFVIHGQQDEVIPYKHGQNLVTEYQMLNKPYKCEFQSPSHMTHNFFDLEEDIIFPIHNFLKNNHKLGI